MHGNKASQPFNYGNSGKGERKCSYGRGEETVFKAGGSEYCSLWIVFFFFIPSDTVPSGLTIYLGRQSQELSNPNEVSRSVSQIIRHPDYNSVTSDNDIALLKLSSPVTFTTYVRPVCLAASGSTFSSGTDSWLTGWGDIGSGREYCTVQGQF